MLKNINVSLAGSGQLYVGYVGVLWALKDYGYNIREIGATSGGAVIAAGIGSGYQPSESMVELACHTLPYKNKLFDPSKSAIRNWGLLEGRKIEDKFRELYVPNIGGTSIPIYVTSSNLNKEMGMVWSSIGTPGADLPRVVRASISLPFIFQPVKIDGDLHVDGGLTYNSPTGVFESDLPILSVSFGSSPGPIGKFLGFLGSIANTTVNSNGLQRAASKLRLDLGYSGFNYFIGDDDVKIMVEKAYKGTEEWLSEHKEELGDL